MSSPLNLRESRRPINVGVIVMNDVTELIDVGQVSLLHSISTEFISKSVPPEFLTEEMLEQAPDMKFFWVSEDGGNRALTTLNVEKTVSFADCPTLDIVVLGAASIGYQCTTAELDFLRKSYHSSSATLLICGGFLPALHAGLLEGKTCTAPRLMLGELRKTAPGVTWVEQRWCQDGKLWTSGAAMNGLDAMREFMLQNWGVANGPSLAKFMLQLGGTPLRENHYNKDDLGWITL